MSDHEHVPHKDAEGLLRSPGQFVEPARTPTHRDVNRTRRRVVAGAIVAPAILTLPTGASAGAFGSFAMCVRNTDETPQYQHVGSTDKWARKQVQGIFIAKVVDSTQTDPTTGQTITTETLDYSNTHVLVQYGSDYFVDERNRRWSQAFDGSFTCSSVDGKYKAAGQQARYTVAYVDDQGNLVGFKPWDDKYGRAITGSCWVSVLPNKT